MDTQLLSLRITSNFFQMLLLSGGIQSTAKNIFAEEKPSFFIQLRLLILSSVKYKLIQQPRSVIFKPEETNTRKTDQVSNKAAWRIVSSRLYHGFRRVLICCLSSCLYYSSPTGGGGCYSFRPCNYGYPRNTFNNTQNADPQSHPQPDRGQRRTHFRTGPDRNSAYLDVTALQRTADLNTSGEERLKLS